MSVNIVEVGPRDGLQNEAITLSVEQRVALIHRLQQAGLTNIEAGSFVSPKWVPQMANSDLVLQQVQAKAIAGQRFPVLTPNLIGYNAAKTAGAKDIAIFAAASESFSQKNINCSIAQSLERFSEFAVDATRNGIRIRGYVSCLVACPYEGDISPAKVVPVVDALFELGCYEVSLGDTIGRGTPKSITAVLQALLQHHSAARLALHCHDTYGMAIANIMAGLQHGIRTIDASIGGAGGCPYAKGASGNVATEEVVYLCQQEGLKTGVDLHQLVDTSAWLYQILNKAIPSKVANALQPQQHGK